MFGRFVICAENLDWNSDGCSELKVCVKNSTTQSDLLSTLFPEDRLVLVDGDLESVESFGNQKCQVYASGVVERTEAAVRRFYPDGEYLVGTVPFTRESLALVTKDDDVVFSKLVDAVVNAIIRMVVLLIDHILF